MRLGVDAATVYMMSDAFGCGYGYRLHEVGCACVDAAIVYMRSDAFGCGCGYRLHEVGCAWGVIARYRTPLSIAP